MTTAPPRRPPNDFPPPNWNDKFAQHFHPRTRTALMSTPLSNEIRALLDAPNFAHLATLMPDGSPQSVPVWVGREGDRILICTAEASLKAKNTRRSASRTLPRRLPQPVSGGPTSWPRGRA